MRKETESVESLKRELENARIGMGVCFWLAVVSMTGWAWTWMAAVNA